MEITSLTHIGDARRALATEIALLDRLLDFGAKDASPSTIAKQAQAVEDKANALKHVTKRFEEGI